jgi:hypothetical protein
VSLSPSTYCQKRNSPTATTPNLEKFEALFDLFFLFPLPFFNDFSEFVSTYQLLSAFDSLVEFTSQKFGFSRPLLSPV